MVQLHSNILVLRWETLYFLLREICSDIFWPLSESLQPYSTGVLNDVKTPSQFPEIHRLQADDSHEMDACHVLFEAAP